MYVTNHPHKQSRLYKQVKAPNVDTTTVCVKLYHNAINIAQSVTLGGHIK